MIFVANFRSWEHIDCNLSSRFFSIIQFAKIDGNATFLCSIYEKSISDTSSKCLGRLNYWVKYLHRFIGFCLTSWWQPLQSNLHSYIPKIETILPFAFYLKVLDLSHQFGLGAKHSSSTIKKNISNCERKWKLLFVSRKTASMSTVC